MFTLSHGIPVSSTTVSVASNIEYNNNYYRVGSSWSYADLTVSVAVPVRRLIITPSIRFLGGLADDFEDQVVGGVNVHVDF